MTYRNLWECMEDLERTGRLARIDGLEIDPRLELAAVQRRAYRAGSPALLFSRAKGTRFPVLANLFGSRERIRYIFRDGLRALELLLRARADPLAALKKPWDYRSLPLLIRHALPRKVKSGAAIAGRCALSDLPQIVSWPEDGGAYATLPQVYSEHPAKPGFFASNLGMYRIQISGGDYEPDAEAGLHYQIHRGIGPHHMEALLKGADLPVNVFVGGPPALTLAAIMPLPEGVPEVCLAGVLAGRPLSWVMPEAGFSSLPVPAEADFCICGRVLCAGGRTPLKREGPFGDHLGYYSLAHDFPVLRVDAVYHRPNAVWPFTSVGRPPQEDTVFGEFIHELTAPLVPAVFPGVREVRAVDAAGVHPLLLAVGSERYVPFAAGAHPARSGQKFRRENAERVPQELLTCALSLLGSTQTSLSKYLLIAAREDDPALSVRDVPAFLAHMLKRADFSRDLHFITRTTMDTLDYSGISLNQGSKLVWAAAGEEKRLLAGEFPPDFSLPRPFSGARLFAPGIAVCKGPEHKLPRETQDPLMEVLAGHPGICRENADQGPQPQIALLVVANDPEFVCRDLDNFLWTAFTRSDPAADIYGAGAFTRCRHWGCAAPLIIDARAKPFHAPVLEEDPEVQRRIDDWGAPGGPLHGLV
ncbi:MAG: UbiD family decarboxylase [Desulfovibrio sp.]|jgi:4-hydroxy-3-polyprenylbenzoate decarboxylase|nr:UbiD family decarboxylase [Desulfovibrio sp.]